MEKKASGFQRIITENGSWFLLYYPRDSAWPASRDEPPQRIKQKIGAGKCLISVPWSVNGIHNLLDVPKRTTHNTVFFLDALMPCLIENIWSQTRRNTGKVD
jgi:hypothetical protein